jgi:hypothetical protein
VAFGIAESRTVDPPGRLAEAIWQRGRRVGWVCGWRRGC